jgi:low temperature requirement protein LtrA
MKGITMPERTEDFTADPVELFFDLAYVIAFSQLTGVLIHEPTWAGTGKVCLLFGLLWLPWQQLTWTANALSGNGRGVRVIFLVATVVSVPMAASTSTALEDGGPSFAITLATIMVLGFVMQSLSSERGSGFRRAVVRWITPNVAAIVVLLVGATARGGARIAMWTLAVLIVIGAMVAAGSGDWVIRTGHFAERHGLIVIIAQGEVIVAVGLPVLAALEADQGLPGHTLGALAAAGTFAALMWWGYFDRPGPALEHRAAGVAEMDRGRYARDVYTWCHAPIVLGIILSAAALEEITLHPTAALLLPFRSMLIGGLGLLVCGIGAAIWRAFGVLPKERLVCGALIATLLLLASGWDGIVLLVLVDLTVFATLLVEHRRVEAS